MMIEQNDNIHRHHMIKRYAMRTIIDLTESDRESLDALSRQLGISRAEAIRRAVADFLRSHQPATDAEMFGIWRDRDEDAIAYENRVRSEWNRR